MTMTVMAKSILIVDDEPDICEALLLALGMEGYKVAAANDRDTALKQIDDDPPALIMLDHRMPGLEAADFLAELEKKGTGACIILMTAGKDPGAVARELGLELYLPKPFELETMLQMVRTHCAL